MNSTVRLNNGMAFDTEVGGHTFMIDAHAEVGGQDLGPPPKALMLSALAGCASMDIVSILRKMRAAPDTLEVTADAGMTDDHPKVFKDMSVVVRVTGEVPVKKLWKAVALSRDRYCGVAAMLRKHDDIAYSVFLNGEEVPEPV